VKTMQSFDRTDIQSCHARMRDGSRTFFAASFLLPRRIREPAAALYAFCRVADDAVDQKASSERTVAELRERLARIYSGQPAAAPEDRAFACTVQQFGIPRALPEALLEGFEWDIKRRVYNEIDELHAYSARVAGTVGAMMSIIMGVRSPAAIARACELGMAMQLTNIARDVGEDARAGRLYLPRRWLLEAGIDPDVWLQSPAFNAGVATVVRRVLREADALYARADTGIPLLPLTCRQGIRGARLIYSEIGREVERRGMDSVSTRSVVPGNRKAGLIWRALSASNASKDPELLSILEPSRFLVEAVQATDRPVFNESFLHSTAWWQLNKRIAWTVDLFHRLEQRDQLRR